MRLRDLPLQLDDDPNTPPSRLLAQAIQRAILDGRLAPSMALPGSRALADAFRLNRNTVIAALHDLEAEGWLVSQPNRGTFVADRWPATAQGRGPGSQPSPNFDLPSRLAPISAADPGALMLADGMPDAGLFPAGELAKAYQRALHRHGEELLRPGEPLGNSLLRNTLVDWLRERRGMVVNADQVLITRGSRMALTLLSTALFKEGSVVAVEDPGDRRVWDTMRQCAPVDLEPVPVDGEGLVVEALEELIRRRPVRAIHLRPLYQLPTTVVLSPPRRQRLLELAASARIVILEEDHDAEYGFGVAAPLPLASQDSTGQVIHISSIGRLIAPGLRLGFIVAPKDLVARLARLQRNQDWQGDRVVEWAVADLIRDGALARHLRKARKIYEHRRDTLAVSLRPLRDQWLGFEPPQGGLALWLEPRPGVEGSAVVEAARAQGLILHPPAHFAFRGPGHGMRLGFAQVGETELREVAIRLARACESLRTRI